MSRYFSQERCLQEVKAYIERAETYMENDGYYEAQFEGFEELQDDLFNLETVDLVRCAECKNCKRKRGIYKGEPIFFFRCAEHNRDVESDDYCSWGERRE